MDDRAAVTAQIGRAPRSGADVVTRCHLGLPVVTRVPPILEDGTPFPTLYWLGCPLAVARVSRLESAGGVGAAEAMIAADPAVGVRHEAASTRYREQRQALVPAGHDGPAPTGGVGGARAGVKCLHAHYADYRAGNDNPVGEWAASRVEPLDCALPCVVSANGTMVANPAWSAPRR